MSVARVPQRVLQSREWLTSINSSFLSSHWMRHASRTSCLVMCCCKQYAEDMNRSNSSEVT